VHAVRCERFGRAVDGVEALDQRAEVPQTCQREGCIAMTITLVYTIGLCIGFALGWEVQRFRVAVRDRERARIESAKRQHIDDTSWMEAIERCRK
jgi:hypothetical protein